jgi:hypothetical protein
MQKAIENLKSLTGKSKIILTRRGNKALKFTLRALKDAGKTKILIQDQGGWLTYPQYAKELGLGLVELKTDYGLVDAGELKKKADSNSILLINSMPGYFAYERIVEIAKIAKKAGAVLVNDVSGSIGSKEAKIGDIIFGSFGIWKPLNVEYGGFIATDGDYLGDMQSVFDDKFVSKLMEKLEGMDARIKRMKETARKIKDDLNDFGIIHPDAEGFNVVVKFKDDEEKEKILKYCEQNGFEYTLCPRYIRVNENAVCIEVKRRE